MTAQEEQRKMEYIGAECVKLTLELVAAMKGEPINDIPLEAFLPERDKEEVL
jgi:hypothetical protein